MIRDMLRREFTRTRFAGLPRWLQVVGWIGVGCFPLIFLCTILLKPLLLLGLGYLLLLPAAAALCFGPAAHLLVHNPFRQPPFLPPGVATRLWVFKPLWILLAMAWLIFCKTVVIMAVFMQLSHEDMLAWFGQSTVEVLLDLSLWPGEFLGYLMCASLWLYFGFYYKFSSVGPRTARPRLSEST